MDRWCTLEPPHWGSSNEYPQSMFKSKNKKKMYTPTNPTLTIQKWCVWGATLQGHVSLMLKYIENIWFFGCKIDFYFTEWTPKAVFSWVASPVENTTLVVHEWNKNPSYTRKIKYSVSFMLKCGKNKLISVRQPSSQKINFFLVILRHFYDVQRVYWE